MDEFTGMVFHSAEREVERLERQLVEARQEAAELRRQLAECQAQAEDDDRISGDSTLLLMAEIAELRRQLTEERMRANAAEFAVAQLRADAADLRRQGNRAGYEYREVQRALAEVGLATGADDPTSPESILDALADLRRQLEHANRWRDNEILAANEARAESADLRRQLAETQATIAALRIANAAYAEIAAICPACGGGGEVNSGRVTPHGDEIYVICPTCQGSGRAYIADTPHRAGKGDMFARGEMVSADAMPDVQPSPHGAGEGDE